MEPGYNSRCTRCKAEANWRRNEAQAALKLCAHCFKVEQARKAGATLLECMTCDDRAILDEREQHCKPCKVRRKVERLGG